MVEAREMAGLENRKQNGSKIFTAESQIYAFGSPWGNAGNRMMQDSNYLQYGKEYPQSNADWALEVFSQHIWIAKMKERSFNVILKLVDTNSGKKVALEYSYDQFAISLGKDISNFKSFEDEFRNAATHYVRRRSEKWVLFIENRIVQKTRERKVGPTIGGRRSAIKRASR